MIKDGRHMTQPDFAPAEMSAAHCYLRRSSFDYESTRPSLSLKVPADDALLEFGAHGQADLQNDLPAHRRAAPVQRRRPPPGEAPDTCAPSAWPERLNAIRMFGFPLLPQTYRNINEGKKDDFKGGKPQKTGDEEERRGNFCTTSSLLARPSLTPSSSDLLRAP